MQIESFSQGPLSGVIPSYLYDEYSDDSDLQAFFSTYNALAQSYVDWFNNTPLALYTSANINGELLDWTATGIYGIERPVIISLSVAIEGAMDSLPMNKRVMSGLTKIESGTAQVADDDVYKRVLTWHLYKGDGVQSSISWLRKRVARFLFGANGSDVSLDDLQQVSIVKPQAAGIGAMNTLSMNSLAMNMRKEFAPRTLEIIIATSNIAKQFANLLAQGVLALPFQVTYRVTLT